jgi:toxin ParE1/3/4
MRFEFHPEALAEYDDAAAYYAGRERGLDLRFIEAVENAAAKVKATPHR